MIAKLKTKCRQWFRNNILWVEGGGGYPKLNRACEMDYREKEL